MMSQWLVRPPVGRLNQFRSIGVIYLRAANSYRSRPEVTVNDIRKRGPEARFNIRWR